MEREGWSCRWETGMGLSWLREESCQLSALVLTQSKGEEEADAGTKQHRAVPWKTLFGQKGLGTFPLLWLGS